MHKNNLSPDQVDQNTDQENLNSQYQEDQKDSQKEFQKEFEKTSLEAEKDEKFVFLTHTRIMNYLPIIKEMYPFIKTKKRFKGIIEKLFKNEDNIFVGLEVDGQPVGFCDFSIYFQLWDERMCYVNHLIVSREHRGSGYGSKLLNFVTEYAQNQGCEGVELRSELFRKKAHTFYYKKGYQIDCFNFRKDLKEVRRPHSEK